MSLFPSRVELIDICLVHDDRVNDGQVIDTYSNAETILPDVDDYTSAVNRCVYDVDDDDGIEVNEIVGNDAFNSDTDVVDLVDGDDADIEVVWIVRHNDSDTDVQVTNSEYTGVPNVTTSPTIAIP